mgnify:CR=1 FL=1
MTKKTNPGLKIICLNRKASFNYFFEDLLEAGIVLKGAEIKSIRDGKVNIADSYAIEKNGELILINSHIASYKQASYSNHNPLDERKLLLDTGGGILKGTEPFNENPFIVINPDTIWNNGYLDELNKLEKIFFKENKSSLLLVL